MVRKLKAGGAKNKGSGERVSQWQRQKLCVIHLGHFLETFGFKHVCWATDGDGVALFDSPRSACTQACHRTAAFPTHTTRILLSFQKNSKVATCNKAYRAHFKVCRKMQSKVCKWILFPLPIAISPSCVPPCTKPTRLACSRLLLKWVTEKLSWFGEVSYHRSKR